MRVGKVMIIAVLAMGMISTVKVMTPDNSEAEEIAASESELDVYIDKKMYSEAIGSYKKLLNLDKYTDDYEKWNDYHNYALEYGFESELTDSCKKLLALDPSLTQPAKNVLDWYINNDFESVYGWLEYLRNTLPQEYNVEFDEYYDTIKGEYSVMDKGFSELGDWASAVFDRANKADTYLIGSTKDGKRVVVKSNGDILAQKELDKIISYSYAERLLAGRNEDQLVYIDVREDRKRVPYDYTNKVLLNNKYLGPYCNGIANFCDENDNWGFINSRADIIYSGYQHTTPGNEGIFAAQDENGTWSILYLKDNGKLGKVADTDFSEIKTDEYGYMVKNGVFFGCMDNKWYMNKITVDQKGNYGIEKLDTEYEDAKMYGDLGAVMLSGKWGFVDKNGEMIISPQFEDAKSFSCGFAAVKQNGLWGYIDLKGNVIIDYTFDAANSFSRYGVAAVMENDRWYLIRLNEYKISGGVYK